MNEESLKVLRMVADGKLSAEQANELLTVLETERRPTTEDDDGEQEPTTATDTLWKEPV